MSPRRIAASAVFGVALAVMLACTQGGELRRITDVDGPSFQQFRDSVSPYLEVRCASIDCHGQAGRPLRIYSGRGLRLQNDAGAITGVTGTSAQERLQNWISVVGLEPENMRRVVEEGGFNPERLFMVTKPRGGQDRAAPGGVIHKGGAVVRRGDDEGDLCMTTWLAENVDKAACTKAASVP